MILQALKEYYDRKAPDPEAQMAPPGFEWKEIPFIIVLKPDGTPVNIEQTYEGEGKKRRAKQFLVPQAVKKTSGISSNLLWDNPEYVLGVVLKGKPERVIKQHIAFRKRIDELGDMVDEGLSAVRKFLSLEDKERILRQFGEPWESFVKEGRNLSFKLVGDNGLVLERPALKSAIMVKDAEPTDEKQALCLVTGEKGVIQRLHTAVKVVWGAQSSGANIVSFNLDAFKSFNKDQGANAPVGKTAAFAYTTALNHLLTKGSKQRMQVGDTSTVFWAEKVVVLEQDFADFFSEPDRKSVV